MIQKMFPTKQGSITYWITASKTPSKPWLVFLPGLTANHHLFKDQIEHFKGKANLFVWDPPSHGASRPFNLNWNIQQLGRMAQCHPELGGYHQPRTRRSIHGRLRISGVHKILTRKNAGLRLNRFRTPRAQPLPNMGALEP